MSFFQFPRVLSSVTPRAANSSAKSPLMVKSLCSPEAAGVVAVTLFRDSHSPGAA
jgi:hypothetical protein